MPNISLQQRYVEAVAKHIEQGRYTWDTPKLGSLGAKIVFGADLHLIECTALVGDSTLRCYLDALVGRVCGDKPPATQVVCSTYFSL